MSISELLALSLILSIAASALVWFAGVLVERASADPRLRDRVWGAGLLLSALPPLAVAILLLAPAPVQEVAAPAIVMAPVMVAPTVQAEAVPTLAALPDLAVFASLFLMAAAGMGLVRLVSLTVRVGRLMRLLRHAVPADADLTRRVEAIGGRLEIQPPRTVVSATVGEALLSGLGRPCLILPRTPDAVASDAVIAHELAHLKRGDHRTLWLEEALVVLLAINPLIPALRARRDAAREEACDALALAAAEPAARRAYAQTLIEALRTRAGPRGGGDAVAALTFTGAGRTSAMHRLKAVMTPAAPAGRRTRLIALSLTVGLAATVGAASWAVADQRPVRTIVSADAAAPSAGPDLAYVSAAFNPVYRAAWPDACGFGSESDGRVFVLAGDCATGDGSKIEILSLAGVAFSTEARAAFAAVRTACDAGRLIEIAYLQNGVRDRVSVACVSPAVAPPEPVRLTVDLTYDPAIRIAAGDKLEIELRRNMEGGGTASSDIVLNLAPGALPGQAFADLRPPQVPADLRNGPMFALSARIVGTDGAVKAVSDRNLGRPHAPYLTSARAISTAMRMLPMNTSAQAAAEALPGEPALTVRIGRSDEPFLLGSSQLLRVTLQGQDGGRGARNITRLEMPIAPGQPLEREVRFPLSDEQLPTLTAGRTYDLTAEIRDADGRVFYAAEPVTVRMAPGSRGRLAGMRPELVLARTAAVAPPALATRAYRARLTITENGQVVASGRMRLVPGDGAVTNLNADGRDYQVDMSMEGPESDPEGRGRLTVLADVVRAAEAGGWETLAKPRLLMAADGQARMTWGDEAGLMFEIVVEPA
ncbi:M56 family metallopeptidase [Brevundimonas sp.]|uniref:M56 family metallopeptidase n=1 Tax=Brevundimonas sp. TaxID=1871086 RepID=UPI003D0EE639